MRAARVHAFGELADISIDEIPVPVPGDGEVLIRVVAAALNPIDYKVALTGHRGNRTLPLTLGFDAVGIVEAVGAGVSSVAVGDRVCAMTDIMAPGTAAEYVVVGEHNLATVPNGVGDGPAAGLPLAALTALQAWDLAGVRSGQTVLIHAGGGGVGHLAIQLAKIRGATVYATASSGNLDLLADLGADHPIDYHSTPPSKFAGLVDAVLDTQGGETAAATLRAMKPGSTLVSIVGFTPQPEEAREDVRVERMLVEPRAAQLADLVRMLAAGNLRVVVHDVAPFDRFVDSIQGLYAGHTVGKRIIAVA